MLIKYLNISTWNDLTKYLWLIIYFYELACFLNDIIGNKFEMVIYISQNVLSVEKNLIKPKRNFKFTDFIDFFGSYKKIIFTKNFYFCQSNTHSIKICYTKLIEIGVTGIYIVRHFNLLKLNAYGSLKVFFSNYT